MITILFFIGSCFIYNALVDVHKTCHQEDPKISIEVSLYNVRHALNDRFNVPNDFQTISYS
jgi:hypothetical protein